MVCLNLLQNQLESQYTSSLIDLCLTNFPEKISKSGVINIGISDHSAIYLTRKVASLTGIFNQSLMTGIFLSDWKMGKVSPIFKNGSKSDLNNYRPISVIPTVAKIFEKIINDQLYQYLNENGLLNSGQSGFRSLQSTLTTLLEANDNLCVNIDRGLLNGVIFIDLKKAFDTTDQE